MVVQVRAVVVISEGRGVIPPRSRGSDQACALPQPTAMYAIAEKGVGAPEVHRAGWGGGGVGGRTLEDHYGHARVFEGGAGAWRNEQMRERKVNSARRQRSLMSLYMRLHAYL